MKLHFFKYQGTGNDFVLADNRRNEYDKLSTSQIKKICDRRFGVGADGFMLLNEKEGFDFEMIYYNADGREGSMCGNGGRCIVRFANELGIKKSHYRFLATDGPHDAEIDEQGSISLKMNDVTEIGNYKGSAVLNTGSPHVVKLVTGIKDFDVINEGKKIRYNKDFEEKGINVNFVEPDDDTNQLLNVRTYERGVEGETYSCGTGVTASALVFYHNENGFNSVDINTLGGKLNVSFHRNVGGSYKNIWLKGPAVKVFEGDIAL